MVRTSNRISFAVQLLCGGPRGFGSRARPCQLMSILDNQNRCIDRDLISISLRFVMRLVPDVRCYCRDGQYIPTIEKADDLDSTIRYHVMFNLPDGQVRIQKRLCLISFSSRCHWTWGPSAVDYSASNLRPGVDDNGRQQQRWYSVNTCQVALQSERLHGCLSRENYSSTCGME